MQRYVNIAVIIFFVFSGYWQFNFKNPVDASLQRIHQHQQPQRQPSFGIKRINIQLSLLAYSKTLTFPPFLFTIAAVFLFTK